MKVNSVVSGQGWAAAAGSGRLFGRSIHDRTTGSAPASDRPAAQDRAPSTLRGSTRRNPEILRFSAGGSSRETAGTDRTVSPIQDLAASVPSNLDARERLEKMLESISSIFDELRTGLTPESEQAARQALEAFAGTVLPSNGAPSLATELRTAFQDLMHALQTLFGDPPTNDANRATLVSAVEAAYAAATGDGAEARPSEAASPAGTRDGFYGKAVAAYDDPAAGESASTLRLVV